MRNCENLMGNLICSKNMERGPWEGEGRGGGHFLFWEPKISTVSVVLLIRGQRPWIGRFLLCSKYIKVLWGAFRYFKKPNPEISKVVMLIRLLAMNCPFLTDCKTNQSHPPPFTFSNPPDALVTLHSTLLVPGRQMCGWKKWICWKKLVVLGVLWAKLLVPGRRMSEKMDVLEETWGSWGSSKVYF